MKIKNLFYYPIKSMGPIEVEQLSFTRSGPKHDREWVLVDANHRFISQRDFPELATFKPSIKSNSLQITHPTGEKIEVDFSFFVGVEPVQIWKDKVLAHSQGTNVDEALSDWLKAKVRLFRYESNSPRLRSKPRGEFETRFADGFQFLLTNTGSLSELEQITGETIPMDRFRANVVIEDLPWSELKANSVLIGESQFTVMQPCQRCVMITIDQSTGVITKSKALKKLSELNLKTQLPEFGIYLKAETQEGVINLGDHISLIP